jgi:hypothetical protein
MVACPDEFPRVVDVGLAEFAFCIDVAGAPVYVAYFARDALSVSSEACYYCGPSWGQLALGSTKRTGWWGAIAYIIFHNGVRFDQHSSFDEPYRVTWTDGLVYPVR